MMRASGSGKQFLSWWQLVVFIDLFLVLMTLLKKYPVPFPGMWFLVHQFNLATEMNAGVWWAMACLLVPGLIAYELFSRQEGKTRGAWLALAAVLVGLALDEFGSIHERAGWTNRGICGALLIVLVAYAVSVLYRNRESRRSALLIAAAFSVFGLVALQEYLEHRLPWPGWALGIRVGVEEGSELLGSFLLCWAVVIQRRWVASEGLSALIPNPFLMKKAGLLMLAGAGLHLLGSLVVPGLVDVTQQGNPLAWYPSAGFFLLFTAAYWQRLSDPGRNRGHGAALALFFLFCSVSFAYHHSQLPDGIGALVPARYAPALFLFSLLAGLLLLDCGFPNHRCFNAGALMLLLVIPVLCLLSRAPQVRYLAYGLLAYGVFSSYWTEGTRLPHGTWMSDP